MKKSTINLRYLVFIIAFWGFLFSSCKKQIESNKSADTIERSLKVENGYLTFQSSSAFSDFLQKINSLTEIERLNVEKGIGFNSLYSLYQAVKEKVNICNTRVEIDNILKGYENLFSYSENGLILKNENDLYAKIIDKNGFFKIGAALYKSIDKGKIIATCNNYTILQSINSVDDYLKQSENDIQIDRFKNKSDFINSLNVSKLDADPYTSGSNKYYLISVRNESNNRRLYVEMIQYIGYFPQYTFGTYGTYTGFGTNTLRTLGFSHTKKGSFGIWSSYTSPTYISEISTYGPYNGGPNVWYNEYSGTLNNNSASQTFNGLGFGTTSPTYYYPASAAATWVEPIYNKPTRIVCTGNGQNWYTNTYL